MSTEFDKNKISKEINNLFSTFKKYYFTERNLEGLKTIFSKEIINIGSGSDEFNSTYKDAIAVFERDQKQAPNPLEYKFHSEYYIPLTEISGMIAAELDIFTIIDDTPVSLPGYRFTMICNKEDGAWKVMHTHISKGEHKLEEGESFPLKEIEERNKLLKQIVQERTKELEEVNKDIIEIKERFESVFENVSDGIIVADWPSKKFFMINHQICDLLGYKKSELEKIWISDLIPEEYWEQSNKQFIDQQTGKRALAEDIPLYTKDKKIRFFDINSKIIHISEKPYYVGLFRDITEKKLSTELQKEMEVARKSSEAKDFFLANISHEIRTPVTGIIGMSEILSQTNLNQEQKEYLSIINDSSKILLDLINDILDISKIEAGKVTLIPSFFNLKDMLANIMSLFGPAAEKQNLKFNISFNNDLPDKIKADKKRLEQVLMNLIFNALKYTKSGSIDLILSCKDINKEVIEITIEVKDTGLGICKKDQEKIFDKFFQLDSSLSRTAGGAGLGLFICRELVKLMGGKIGVESYEGKGSCFWFTFKAMKLYKKKDEEIKSGTDDIESNLDINALVVDDKYVNRRVVSLMLEKLGCKVDLATNGQEALNVFDPKKHQVIFMDIMMPVMDGIEAMKKLREKYPKLPPILALTANAMEGDDKKYIEQGFTSYMAKPVTIADLTNMFKELDLV